MPFSLDSNIQSIIVQLDDAKLELVLAIREVIRTSNKDIKEKIKLEDPNQLLKGKALKIRRVEILILNASLKKQIKSWLNQILS